MIVTFLCKYCGCCFDVEMNNVKVLPCIYCGRSLKINKGDDKE